MSPETKFHSLIVGLTIPLMLAGVRWVSPLIERVSTFQFVLGAATAILASAGAYRLLAIGLSSLLTRVEWLKAWLLGPNYVHGTWVGWFKGPDGDTRYIVEWFEQSLTTLTIRGQSYTEAGDTHALWFSEAAFVDPLQGRIIYTYTGHVLRSNVSLQGVGIFQLVRAGLKAAPTAMEGYSADLVDGVRIGAREAKVGRELFPVEKALPFAPDVAKRLKLNVPIVAVSIPTEDVPASQSTHGRKV